MGPTLASWITALDAFLAAALVPLALAILLSGLDDLYLSARFAFEWMRRRSTPLPAPPPLRSLPQKRMAIFVPCWKESPVISRMIEHNVAAIDYRSYHFFIGAYPNDEPTLQVVHQLEARFENVHLATCPHDGPTSKADCLNWIFQRMLLFEEDRQVRFEVVVTHDAEDLIHPESLLTINRHIGAFDMVQIPVLPLPTPLYMLTHGVYCDEFAEFQMKDMPARGYMGSFIPSNGVGTGYSRAALEKLARSESNRIFDPACLTEDYENGMRLHLLGCSQLFVPLAPGGRGLVATREFFPSTLAAAIRQRTRWVTGIALQTWERHGWSGPRSHKYWFWRDRRGLLGSPLSLLTNVVFVVGLAAWIFEKWTGSWHPAHLRRWAPLFILSGCLQVFHTAVRMLAVSRIYGFVFALGVVPRTLWANYINAASTCRAVHRYVRARLRREPLIWVKTEHAYPSRSALFDHKRRLRDILTGSGYIDPETMDAALLSRPPGVRLGDHLIALGVVTADDLYEALSLQQSLPMKRLDPSGVHSNTARSLPRRVIDRWKVLPYRIEAGDMFLASPEIPTDDMHFELRGFTRMTLRFELVTPANFEQLTSALL